MKGREDLRLSGGFDKLPSSRTWCDFVGRLFSLDIRHAVGLHPACPISIFSLGTSSIVPILKAHFSLTYPSRPLYLLG